MEPKSGLEVGTRLKHECNFFAFFLSFGLFSFSRNWSLVHERADLHLPPHLARFNYQHVPNRDLDRSVVRTSQNFFFGVSPNAVGKGENRSRPRSDNFLKRYLHPKKLAHIGLNFKARLSSDFFPLLLRRRRQYTVY